MFATKETVIIAVVVLIAAAIATAVWMAIRHRGRNVSSGADVVEHRDLTRRMAERPPADHGALWRRLILMACCVTIFLGVNVAFFSSFFTHWEGVRDALRAYELWTATGTRHHIYPWWTYVQWFWKEEAPLFCLGLTGCIMAIWSSRNAFAVFAALWAVGMFCAYSLILYKTPWLSLNFLVPMAIAAGWAAEETYLQRSAARRRGVAVAAALAIGWSAYQAVILNFVRYDDERRPYVYAHTSRETLQLVERIAEIRARAGPNVRISIAVLSPEHFPLPWYLRNYPAGFYGRVVETGDAILLASQKQDEALKMLVGSKYVLFGTYKLRPGVDIVAYVRSDVMH